MPRHPTVARQMLAWQVVVVAVLVVGGIALAWYDARSDGYATARDRAVDVALAVAASPTVASALDDPEPSLALQPYAEQVRRETGTDFVVVMSRDGIRYSHTNPEVIGQRFRGHTAEALAGQTFTERYTGTLGPSVRSVVPVEVDGQVRGLVSVGIRTQKVDAEVVAALPRIVTAALAVGALGLVGAWLVSRRLRRQTHGLGAHEITRMYEYYDAVLRSVREGLLLIDPSGRVTMLNDEAARLLDLPDAAAAEGVHVTDLGLEPGLARDLAGRDALVDEVQVVGDRVLVVNRSEARWDDRVVGSVVTLRDRTELQGVTARLDTVQGPRRRAPGPEPRDSQPDAHDGLAHRDRTSPGRRRLRDPRAGPGPPPRRTTSWRRCRSPWSRRCCWASRRRPPSGASRSTSTRAPPCRAWC